MCTFSHSKRASIGKRARARACVCVWCVCVTCACRSQCEESEEEFSSQQNLEQMNKCLISLRQVGCVPNTLFHDVRRMMHVMCMQMYADARTQWHVPMPDEAEFQVGRRCVCDVTRLCVIQAYYLLTHIKVCHVYAMRVRVNVCVRALRSLVRAYLIRVSRTQTGHDVRVRRTAARRRCVAARAVRHQGMRACVRTRHRALMFVSACVGCVHSFTPPPRARAGVPGARVQQLDAFLRTRRQCRLSDSVFDAHQIRLGATRCTAHAQSGAMGCVLT
jgi:hypothetical protein